MEISQADKERFLSKVIKTDSCWIWNAGINIWGYGNFWMKGKTHSAHRTSFVIHKGEPSNGEFILHLCDNKKCVNPDHLTLGSQSDNIRDKMFKQREARGERVYGSKLKEFQIKSIRELFETGKYSLEILGKRFKVDPSNIKQIILRKTWKHVK